MKYLVVSDIHGCYDSALKIKELDQIHNFANIIILGDILYHGPRNEIKQYYSPKDVVNILNELSDKIIAIKGNCDSDVDAFVLNFKIHNDYFISMFNKLYYLSHGDKLDLKGDKDIIDATILYGHFHVPKVCVNNNRIYINVGSISLPKENSTYSYAIIDESGINIYDKNNDNLILSY